MFPAGWAALRAQFERQRAEAAGLRGET